MPYITTVATSKPSLLTQNFTNMLRRQHKQDYRAAIQDLDKSISHQLGTNVTGVCQSRGCENPFWSF